MNVNAGEDPAGYTLGNLTSSRSATASGASGNREAEDLSRATKVATVEVRQFRSGATS